MRKEDSRDPWMNHARDPTAAWERSLRPSKPSSLVWILIGVAVVLGGAFVALGSWPLAEKVPHAKERQVVPGSSSAVRAPPVQEDSPRQLDPERAPRLQRFAKCISAGGAVTYSDGPCPNNTRAAEVAVNPDLNLAEGMSVEDRQASMRHNSAIAQSVLEHERRAAENVDTTGSACAQLKELIASIDAAARQPLPGYEQDRLKDQRRHANDRRFALRCG
jgi:hypothetical protein